MPADHQKNFEQLSDLISVEGILNKKIYENLVHELNLLIKDDFEKLLQLLYRIDISEKKLKEKLKENAGRDAADIIADLIVERQQEKQKQRKQSPPKDSSIPEDDKW